MDEFVAAQDRLPRGNTISWYERVTPELSGDQVEALDAALASPDISARAIAVVLEGWGIRSRKARFLSGGSFASGGMPDDSGRVPEGSAGH